MVGAVEEPGERAAGADGAELAVVADQHHLRPCRLGGDQDTQDVAVIGHAGLVDDDHRVGVEGSTVMVEAPQQRGDGAALDAGLAAQGSGGLPGGRRPEHPVAGGLEGVADTGQGGGLARAGHPDHELHPPPGGGDRPHGVGLSVGEPAAQPALLRAMAASTALDGTAAAPVASTPLRNTVAMAASTAMTDAGA